MNKKVLSIVAAVAAFFGGAIWVNITPVVAPLVIFLEVAAGFGCGYLHTKTVYKDMLAALEQKIASMKEEKKAAAEKQKVKIVRKSETSK